MIRWYERKLGWSLSLTSPSHQSSHHSLPVCGFRHRWFCSRRERIFLKKRRGIFICSWGLLWICFLVSPSSRGQKQDAHKSSLLLAPFVFPRFLLFFLGLLSSSPPSVPHLPMSKHSRMISVLIRRRRKKKVLFFKVELELRVPWMLQGDEVHMFLWQGGPRPHQKPSWSSTLVKRLLGARGNPKCFAQISLFTLCVTVSVRFVMEKFTVCNKHFS